VIVETKPPEAIVAAGATASRAVLFSGSAFVIAMLGMLIVPNTIMRSLAAGAILVGQRADPEGRFWSAVVRRVLRRPALSLAIACGLLVAAAVPVLSLTIGANGISTLPDRFISKHGYLALSRSFPTAGTDPVRIVAADHASEPSVRSAFGRLRDRLAADPRFGRGEVRYAPGGKVAALDVPIRGDDAGTRAVAAVRDLRSEVIPGVFAGTDARVLVGGRTAEQIDYLDSVSNPAPYVFLFVLGSTFLLLTIAFRSLIVAATAIVLNLLSVGVAYGLLVLVFQKASGPGCSASSRWT
jgi:putative drug exporter of the RND superfamily